MIFSVLYDPSSLHGYIKKDHSFHICTICGKSNNQKSDVRKHIESVHFPGQFNSPISVIFVTGHSTERTVFLTTTQPTTVRTRFNILFSANCDPSSLYRYIKKESGLFVCTLCGKSSSQRGNLRKHVEGVHFPGQFVYECQTCGKKFNGMNSFSVHKYTVHGR